jgi:glycosyltransferase involved in cell wall biosynthesis
LVENGYPERKITVVQNSIDTRTDAELFHSISQSELSSLRERLGIAANDVVGIYCGGMYKQKRIQFLLSAADKIHENCPNFKLIFLGDGPDSHLVGESMKTRPWLIWAGSKFGREKCLYFKTSDFFLMPGLIGLAILDSFIFQTPIITTDYEFHSPEFEYLENEVNGIVTRNNLTDYIQGVNELIKDRSKLMQLKKNCAVSASKYSIETMVNNFVNGIVKTLNGQ